MKKIFLRILSLIIIWIMIILTTMQQNTVIWLIMAAITFVVIHSASKWAKVTSAFFPGLKQHKSWPLYLIIGVIAGSAYSIGRFFLLNNLGAIRVLKLFPMPVSAAVISTLILIVSNCYIAFAEEMVFRGYVFDALPHNVNKNITICISALLFLLAHSLNGIFSISRIIELLFLSLTLTVIYIKTKSLWTAIGLHFGLDFFSFFLGGDGEASRQYILLSEKTENYKDLMGMTDSILPVVFFILVTVLIRIFIKPSSSKTIKFSS